MPRPVGGRPIYGYATPARRRGAACCALLVVAPSMGALPQPGRGMPRPYASLLYYVVNVHHRALCPLPYSLVKTHYPPAIAAAAIAGNHRGLMKVTVQTKHSQKQY